MTRLEVGFSARSGDDHRAMFAELVELTALHIDKDFELIAALTGQPHERLELR